MADTTEDKSARKTETDSDAEEAQLREETGTEETETPDTGASVTEAEPEANATTDSDDPVATDDPEPVPDAEGASVAEATPDAVTEAQTEADSTEPEASETIDTSEPEPESRDTVAAAPVPAVREKQGSGFVPLLLGGVIAAGLGYGAAYMGLGQNDSFETEIRQALDDQGTRLDSAEELVGTVAALDEKVSGIDLGALETGLSDVQAALGDMDQRLGAAQDAVATLDTRITDLSKDMLEQAVSPEVVSAYERELEQLREAVAQQQADLEARTAEMEQIVQEARALETSAEDQARLAAARAALADVLARMQAGQPYAEPLALVAENGVTVPDAVTASAEDGIPTMAELTGDFPDAAREALAASRKAAAPEEASGSVGLGSFFQSQLGARSVVPQEGSSTDAILSRAEAAVRNGDLTTALTEIEALPPEAKAALSDWLTRAQLRNDALTGASSLAQDLNQQ